MKKTAFAICLLAHHLIFAQIINVEDRRMKHADTVAFHGAGDFGFNIFKNDKRLITTRTALQMEWQRHRHVWMLLGGHNLIHTEGSENVQNDAFAHLRYNFRLPKLWTFEAYSQIQFNQRTRSKLRALVGSGVRLRLHQGKSNRFYLGLSTLFEHAEFNDSKLVNNDLRMSSYFAYYLKLGQNASIAQTTYYQPLIKDFGNRRLSSEAVVVVSLSKHFKLQTKANLSYDNDPRLPETIPNLVYSWTSGLRIEW